MASRIKSKKTKKSYPKVKTKIVYRNVPQQVPQQNRPYGGWDLANDLL